MGVLNTAQRKALPKSDFALPGKGKGPSGTGAGSYPIPDRSHARNALARVSQFGSSGEKATVRRKVARKFPGMGTGYMNGGPVKKMGAAHERAESPAKERREERAATPMQMGGLVPGQGFGDTVPARLTPGEFVVRKPAAQASMPILKKLNAMGPMVPPNIRAQRAAMFEKLHGRTPF